MHTINGLASEAALGLNADALHRRRAAWLSVTWPLIGIALIGAALRLVPVLASDFPLNDGGLFLTMAEDLRANGFGLPEYATYNDLPIPYAYPPLGFYLTALISAVTGTSGVDLLRFVPALASVATIPIVFAIAREWFRDGRMALATTAFFAIAPRSYEWLIGGGGITRAPGFLLAMVAILMAIRMHSAPARWKPIVAGVVLGASALWHPGAGLFGAISAVAIALFVTPERSTALRRVLVVAATSFVVVLPWLIAVVAVHGPGPLIAARASGGSLLDGLLLLAASRPGGGHLEIMGIVTTVSLAICALRRAWLMPVWMIALVLADPRGGASYATLPAAMALAFFVRDIGRMASRAGSAAASSGRRATMAAGAVFVFLLIGVSADSLASRLDAFSPFYVVSAAERDGMVWAARETDLDATFVVVSGRPWSVDAEAEWFPVLADRRSIATVQGYEWFADDAFEAQHRRADRLLRCAAASDASCIERWLADAGEPDYLFLSRRTAVDSRGRECCLQLASLVEDSEVVYRNDDVVIVALRP